MPLLLRVCLVVLFCCASPVAQEACTLCEQAHVVDCPGCNGKGLRSIPCKLCKGTGERKCRKCVKGKLKCSNFACTKGKVGVKGFMKDCKACSSGGKVDCKSCNAGKHKCGCDKNHERVVVCTDCAGGKKIPCPACRLKPFAGDCGVCKEKKIRACQACAQKRKVPLKCITCLNKRRIPCRGCRGHRKVACTRCSARGVTVRTQVVKNKRVRKTSRCDRCKGRGTLACTLCKKSPGYLPCASCAARKDTCGACRKGELPCGMCTDGQLDIAKSLAAGGRKKLALGYANATKLRLEKLKSRIAADRKKAVEALEAVNQKVKDNGGKHTSGTLGRALTLTRQIGTLRAAAKDLESSLAATKVLLSALGSTK